MPNPLVLFAHRDPVNDVTFECIEHATYETLSHAKDQITAQLQALDEEAALLP